MPKGVPIPDQMVLLDRTNANRMNVKQFNGFLLLHITEGRGMGSGRARQSIKIHLTEPQARRLQGRVVKFIREYK